MSAEHLEELDGLRKLVEQLDRDCTELRDQRNQASARSQAARDDLANVRRQLAIAERELTEARATTEGSPSKAAGEPKPTRGQRIHALMCGTERLSYSAAEARIDAHDLVVRIGGAR